MGTEISQESNNDQATGQLAVSLEDIKAAPMWDSMAYVASMSLEREGHCNTCRSFGSLAPNAPGIRSMASAHSFCISCAFLRRNHGCRGHHWAACPGCGNERRWRLLGS